MDVKEHITKVLLNFLGSFDRLLKMIFFGPIALCIDQHEILLEFFQQIQKHPVCFFESMHDID